MTPTRELLYEMFPKGKTSEFSDYPGIPHVFYEETRSMSLRPDIRVGFPDDEEKHPVSLLAPPEFSCVARHSAASLICSYLTVLNLADLLTDTHIVIVYDWEQDTLLPILNDAGIACANPEGQDLLAEYFPLYEQDEQGRISIKIDNSISTISEIQNIEQANIEIARYQYENMLFQAPFLTCQEDIEYSKHLPQRLPRPVCPCKIKHVSAEEQILKDRNSRLKRQESFYEQFCAEYGIRQKSGDHAEAFRELLEILDYPFGAEAEVRPYSPLEKRFASNPINEAATPFTQAEKPFVDILSKWTAQWHVHVPDEGQFSELLARDDREKLSLLVKYKKDITLVFITKGDGKNDFISWTVLPKMFEAFTDRIYITFLEDNSVFKPFREWFEKQGYDCWEPMKESRYGFSFENKRLIFSDFSALSAYGKGQAMYHQLIKNMPLKKAFYGSQVRLAPAITDNADCSKIITLMDITPQPGLIQSSVFPNQDIPDGLVEQNEDFQAFMAIWNAALRQYGAEMNMPTSKADLSKVRLLGEKLGIYPSVAAYKRGIPLQDLIA